VVNKTVDIILKEFANFYISDSTISANVIDWNEIWVSHPISDISWQIGGNFCKTGQKCAKNNNDYIILWVIVLINYIWPLFNLYLGFGAQLHTVNNMNLSIWSPFLTIAFSWLLTYVFFRCCLRILLQTVFYILSTSHQY
jgi:hypothetical protein